MNLAELEIECGWLLNESYLHLWKDPKTDIIKPKNYDDQGYPNPILMAFLTPFQDGIFIISVGFCQFDLFADDPNRPCFFARNIMIDDFLYKYLDLEDLLLKPKPNQ